jgi:serine/threonine protein kinase
VTRYELLDRIGVGGMAEIFRGKAVAAGGFEKPVAIKRILPHLSQDKRFVELLIAEAKVLSLLRHRNITQIFDVGLGDDGQYFLVMEYVDGKDLGAVQAALETRRRKMPFDLALHIVAEICEALEHAHNARSPDGRPMALVHRDVSPSNVLLSHSGEVKLTDFGIAKRAESEQTGHGAVRGKFAYISPEQARNEQIGPRSDVFSVGILLWELVTSRRLFSGLSDLEALRAVREPTAIQRPSEIVVTEASRGMIDARIGRELDDIVMGALARERERRPTAGQLGQQLRGLRYSLETTVGDPATELAKVIDNAEQVARESVQMVAPPVRGVPGAGGFDSMDPAEMTVIRIRTADAFSQRDNDRSIAQARQVIDRFEEEETRLAQLSGDQLRMLRDGAPAETRDSGEASVVTPPRIETGAKPKPQQAPRARRNSEEATRMRAPIIASEAGRGGIDAGFDSSDGEDEPTMAPPTYDGEATRLVIPSRDRRTPIPERRVPAQPPPPQPQIQRERAASAGLPPPMPRREAPPIPATLQIQPPMPAPPMQHQQPMPPLAAPNPFPPPEQPPQFPPGIQPMQQAPQGQYPMWNRADPTAPDSFDRPVLRPRPSGPIVAGFQRPGEAPPPTLFKPWMLVVGALIMALLAFAITRSLISG